MYDLLIHHALITLYKCQRSHEIHICFFPPKYLWNAIISLCSIIIY